MAPFLSSSAALARVRWTRKGPAKEPVVECEAGGFARAGAPSHTVPRNRRCCMLQVPVEHGVTGEDVDLDVVEVPAARNQAELSPGRTMAALWRRFLWASPLNASASGHCWEMLRGPLYLVAQMQRCEPPNVLIGCCLYPCTPACPAACQASHE